MLANIHPGPQDDTYVDYKNADRRRCSSSPAARTTSCRPSIQRSNAKHYKAEGTITEVKEYEGRAHLLPAQEGWEEVADYALEWALEHATTRAVSSAEPRSERHPHHAHRRADGR